MQPVYVWIVTDEICGDKITASGSPRLPRAVREDLVWILWACRRLAKISNAIVTGRLAI